MKDAIKMMKLIAECETIMRKVSCIHGDWLLFLNMSRYFSLVFLFSLSLSSNEELMNEPKFHGLNCGGAKVRAFLSNFNRCQRRHIWSINASAGSFVVLQYGFWLLAARSHGWNGSNFILCILICFAVSKIEPVLINAYL